MKERQMKIKKMIAMILAAAVLWTSLTVSAAEDRQLIDAEG